MRRGIFDIPTDRFLLAQFLHDASCAVLPEEIVEKIVERVSFEEEIAAINLCALYIPDESNLQCRH